MIQFTTSDGCVWECGVRQTKLSACPEQAHAGKEEALRKGISFCEPNAGELETRKGALEGPHRRRHGLDQVRSSEQHPSVLVRLRGPESPPEKRPAVSAGRSSRWRLRGAL